MRIVWLIEICFCVLVTGAVKMSGELGPCFVGRIEKSEDVKPLFCRFL